MFFVFALAYADFGDVCENSRAGATLDLRSRACTDQLSGSPKGLLALHKPVQKTSFISYSPI